MPVAGRGWWRAQRQWRWPRAQRAAGRTCQAGCAFLAEVLAANRVSSASVNALETHATKEMAGRWIGQGDTRNQRDGRSVDWTGLIIFLVNALER